MAKRVCLFSIYCFARRLFTSSPLKHGAPACVALSYTHMSMIQRNPVTQTQKMLLWWTLPHCGREQGIDIKAGGRIKNGNRKAPNSENVYIRLLVKVRVRVGRALS